MFITMCMSQFTYITRNRTLYCASITTCVCHNQFYELYIPFCECYCVYLTITISARNSMCALLCVRFERTLHRASCERYIFCTCSDVTACLRCYVCSLDAVGMSCCLHANLRYQRSMGVQIPMISCMLNYCHTIK